ncbi:methyltransferase domain-containing protein [Candidatus Thiothrix sp. Deng01]|uniref:Methyltransferase domain-containing protein n=1 Tax=Candidatus Thiothrix phosphatis TaxID=3112415 RepID=A0ABU6CW46_9GAMM|nr:methyltransferase domain-containing protein [Candidatus Thiothrix sp. Deng01]MEB4590796.1 methyltransferase domain-containing protein [Candidatus Thiothrix sp. Deng01]
MSGVLWNCPVCEQPLQRVENSLVCANQHSFDRAKEGYVNLLLANKKKSADPGDNREMLESRRCFLQQGYYAPLAEGIANAVTQYYADRIEQGDVLTLLDAGCGEGYYLARLIALLPGTVQGYGTDISRTAMRMAARQYSGMQFAVASSFDLPVADAAVDVLLRVFAPAADGEIVRVLRGGGLYLWAYPGPRHLFELRQLVYDDPKLHSVDESKIPQGQGLTLHDTLNIRYALKLPDQASVAALLAMTPYFWSASADKQAHCQQLQSLDVTVDFQVAVMVKATRE